MLHTVTLDYIMYPWSLHVRHRATVYVTICMTLYARAMGRNTCKVLKVLPSVAQDLSTSVTS